MTQNIVPTVSIPNVSITAPLGSPLAAAILALIASNAPASPASPGVQKPATKPAPAAEVEETEAPVTIDEVVAQTRAASEKIGVPAIKTLLKKFKKARASELEPKQFAAYLKALNEATDTL